MARYHRVLLATGTWVLLFGVVVLWQSVSGAYRAELAGHADEAAHYVTGLMLRDYAASLFPGSPIRFAEQYYLHYPKVAIGHWPPVFYIIEAAWMLVFSPSRISVLLLMALITTACAFTLRSVVSRAFGTSAGAVAALVFVCLPVIQKNSCMIMADMLVALLCFRAAIVFGRYLDNPNWRDAVKFGIYASLAIITKGNAFALALLPPTAILLARRPAIIKRLSLWASAALVVLLCGPWQFLTINMVRNGWVRDAGLDYTLDAITRYASLLMRNTGIGIIALAVLGAVVTLCASLRHPERPQGARVAALALCISVAVFNCVVPATIEDRLLIPLLAPLLVLAVDGVAWVARRAAFLVSAPLPVRAGIVVFGLALIFARTTFSLPILPHLGFDRAAETILADPRLKDEVILVSSEENGEGALIAEVAMREARPGHIILRGSKVLAHSLWDGRGYQRTYQTPAEIMQYVTGIPIRVLVLDTSPGPALEHHRQLLEMIDDYPQNWTMLASFPEGPTASAGAIRVYTLAGYDDRPHGKVRVDLNPMVNRVIER